MSVFCLKKAHKKKLYGTGGAIFLGRISKVYNK